MFKALLKKIKKLFAKNRVVRGEYRGSYLFVDLPEGGDFGNMRNVHFSPKAITGDIQRVKSRPIRFYFELVGFEDANALMRNWGMSFETFMKRCRKWRDMPDSFWDK